MLNNHVVNFWDNFGPIFKDLGNNATSDFEYCYIAWKSVH